MMRIYKRALLISIPLLLAIILFTGNKLVYYDKQILSTYPKLPFNIKVWRDTHLEGSPAFIIADGEGMMLAGERHMVGNVKMDMITKYGIGAKHVVVPFTDTAGVQYTALTDGRTIWLDEDGAHNTEKNIDWRDIHDTPMGLYRFHAFCFYLLLLILVTYPLINWYYKLRMRKEAGLD